MSRAPRRTRGPATVFPDCTLIRANNRSPMTLDGTRSFIIGSAHPVVIDPGPAEEDHLEVLQRVLAGAAPAAILLTHAHADHAGNAVALADRTDAPILMGKGAPRMPFPPARVSRWLADGEVVECDAGPVEVHATPGHAPEHLAFSYRDRSGAHALFAGDLFLGAGDTTLVSHPHGSIGDYLRSLEVIAALQPTVIFPAHGPALRRPERTVARYRAHRMERIGQVREARRGDAGIGAEELVRLVYGPDLDPRLHSAALGSVQAILVYLDSEGKNGTGSS